MPRVKSSPKKCIKTNLQQSENTWVFLLKGEALELSEQYTGTGTPDIVTLRHPNTGESAVFLFSPANNSVQEVLTFNEAKRSWFIDETVKSDGKLHLSTPIDPIFLVLPYLRKYCTTYAQPLDQLLRDEEFPETERLLKSSGLNYLNMIADKKGDEDLNAFKYNEDKTLNWLKRKTERVAEILKQKNIHVGTSGVVSSNFIKSAKSETVDHEAYLRYAHGIVSEYLMDDLSLKLLKFLGLPEHEAAPQSLKRKSTSTTGQEQKKLKLEEDTTKGPSSSILDLTKPEVKSVKPPSLTAKDKARAKAASSSKTISSFFKKS
ncbi:ribonuclease H2 subunit B [Euwallacea similis]|uniref:ribonuclease H2 subunit B n=1 Tax=Euwallacea similis TaxID=1736056 RepID=UPI00344EBE20